MSTSFPRSRRRFSPLKRATSAGLLASAILAGSLEAQVLRVDVDAWLVQPGQNSFSHVYLRDGGIIFGAPLEVSEAYILSRGWIHNDMRGPAGVEKVADWLGAVYLTGENTYTGDTIVKGGTLSIGDADSGLTGSISSTSQVTISQWASLELYLADGASFSNSVANAGTLSVRSDGVTSIDTSVTGGGRLLQAGAGTTILTQASDFSEINVTRGTLRIEEAQEEGYRLSIAAGARYEQGEVISSISSLTGSGTLFLESDVDLYNSYLIVDSGTADSTFNGTLAGRGTVSMVGTGTLTLAGASTLTGVLEASSGTIRLGAEGVLTEDINLVILNTGTVDLDGYNQSTGIVRMLSEESRLLLGGGDLAMGADNNFILGVVDGGGNGSLTIRDEGGLFFGETARMTGGSINVESGFLSLKGGASEVNVSQNGLVYGSGLISHNLNNTGGFVVPVFSMDGDSLRILGDYRQTGGDLFVTAFDVTPTGHTEFFVGGKTILKDNARLTAIVLIPMAIGDKIVFLRSEGGFSGEFKEDILYAHQEPGLFRVAVKYNKTKAWLEGVYAPFASVAGLTANQAAVARALDSASAKGKMPGLVGDLVRIPEERLPALYQLFSPEEFAVAYNIGFAAAQVQQSNLTRRMDDIRSGSSGFSTSGLVLTDARGTISAFGAAVDEHSGLTLAGFDGKALVGGSIPLPVESRWGFFATGSGEWADIESTPQARGASFSTGGITVGGDYRVASGIAIGLAGSYANTGSDLSNGGSATVNSGKGSLYGTLFNENAYLSAGIGGGGSSYTFKRATLGGIARSSATGGEFNTFLSGGYDYTLGGLTAGPIASLGYTYLELGGFEERASGARSEALLRFPVQSQESLRSAIGAKLSYHLPVAGAFVVPEVRAQWQHEYLDSTAAVVSSFAAGGNPFTVRGPQIGRDSLLLEAGVTARFTPHTSASIFYAGELGRANYSSHGINGGLRFQF